MRFRPTSPLRFARPSGKAISHRDRVGGLGQDYFLRQRHGAQAVDKPRRDVVDELLKVGLAARMDGVWKLEGREVVGFLADDKLLVKLAQRSEPADGRLGRADQQRMVSTRVAPGDGLGGVRADLVGRKPLSFHEVVDVHACARDDNRRRHCRTGFS